MTQNQATLIGLTAILLWSSVVGLIRTVSDHFGALGGAALMYRNGYALGRECVPDFRS